MASDEVGRLLSLRTDLEDLGSGCADQESLLLFVEVEGGDARPGWCQCCQIDGMQLLHIPVPNDHLAVKAAGDDLGVYLGTYRRTLLAIDNELFDLLDGSAMALV